MLLLIADLIPHGDPSVGAYIGLMAVGFLIGIAGHITKIKPLIALGIGLIFLAVWVFPLLLQRSPG